MKIPRIEKEGTFVREFKLVDNGNPVYVQDDNDKTVEVSINFFKTLTLDGKEFRFMSLKEYKPICVYHFCYHSEWTDVLIFEEEGDIMAIGIKEIEITKDKMVYQLREIPTSALIYALQLYKR